jgi:hypothetical protein
MSMKDGAPIKKKVKKGDKKEPEVGMSYAMAGPFKWFAFAVFAGIFGCCVVFAKQMVDAENAPKKDKRASAKRDGKKKR